MQFTHYEIELYNGGTSLVGRPVNPYPVTHLLYFEFEEFAKENTCWCTTDCSPGLYEKELIYPLRCNVSVYAGVNPEFAMLDSAIPIHIHKEKDTDGSMLYYYFVYDNNTSIPSKYAEYYAN